MSGSEQSWEGQRVCVAGIGVSGAAAVRTLLRLGARVTVVDARDGAAERERAAELRALGASVRLGDGDSLPRQVELVVTSPGWRPDARLVEAARTADVPVIGEVELAWRVQPRAGPHWLGVTGTNGKTTAVRMLEGMLTAAGFRAAAVGNVGAPIVEAVLADPPYDVLAVELSSFQLHWAHSLRPRAAAVLNVAPDHLDWHGSLEAYAADKGRIFHGDATNIFNAEDAWSARLAGDHRGAVGCTLGRPGPGQLGVVEGWLVDRAFPPTAGDDGRCRFGGVVLAASTEVRPQAPHNIANALAAAALARAFGVPAVAVPAGLRDFLPDPHRITRVATVRGVDYVDDSKATNPHAAAASLSAYPSIVWIAGGQLKGADVDDLVLRSATRLRAAVVLGADRARITQSLGRHAPNVPVTEVNRGDTGAMDVAVRKAARQARAGDTVLLAPAAASLDMFESYAVRGDAFADAVARLRQELRERPR